MLDPDKWFVIINPTSGNGAAKKLWPKIEKLLLTYQFDFTYEFTSHPKHSVELVYSTVNQGVKNIICIGGDGTIHNIVNGVMLQKEVPSADINIGVIPVGTGNDWVKTYNIPKDPEEAIKIIKNGHLQNQDIGKIETASSPSIYFNNLAGIGFDGYVVSIVGKYKHFGALAYLIGAVIGIFSFKNFNASVIVNNTVIKTRSLMVLVGLCKYSGGGMQLTKEPDPTDGLFDISIAKDFSKWDILKNITRLFNGSIVHFKKVETLKADQISIKIHGNIVPFIQADGELIGSGEFNVSLIPNAVRFYCK